MNDDHTCFYYYFGDCYCARNADRKCCDPSYECAHYKAPVPYITLKSIYLREVHGNGKRDQRQRISDGAH